MPNPTIWQLTTTNGTTYDIEDRAARQAAAAGLQLVKCTQASDTPQGVKWMDGSTEITGTLAASSSTTGKFYLVPAKNEESKDIFSEYITVVSGTSGSETYSWEKIGDTEINFDALGALAYKDSASGTYKRAKNVSQPSFTGSELTSTGSNTPAGTIQVNAASGSGTSYTPSGSVQVNAASGSGTSYTPEGSVAAPTISVASAGATESITPFGSAGTLPSLTMSVSEGNLTFSFSQGTLPSGGTPVSVKTGDASYSASAPAFTGTEKKFAFAGDEKKLAFSGTAATYTVKGTPAGSVSQPTITEEDTTVTVS